MILCRVILPRLDQLISSFCGLDDFSVVQCQKKYHNILFKCVAPSFTWSVFENKIPGRICESKKRKKYEDGEFVR